MANFGFEHDTTGIRFGTEPALIGPHGIAFGTEPALIGPHGTSFGDDDDELTEGMTTTSADIMLEGMDIAPFHDVLQPGGQIAFGVEPALIGPHGTSFGDEHGIEYGDMSMSTFGQPPSARHHLVFGTEPALIGPHTTAFGIGVIIPSQASHVPAPPPPQDGDGSGGSSSMGSDYEDYGAGDQGEAINNSLADSSGGGDPFALARFGAEAVVLPTGVDLTAENDGENMSFEPVGPDPYDPPEQRPTQRNPIMRFGFEDEWYSGFGSAALFGGEVGCDPAIGCDESEMF